MAARQCRCSPRASLDVPLIVSWVDDLLIGDLESLQSLAPAPLRDSVVSVPHRLGKSSSELLCAASECPALIRKVKPNGETTRPVGTGDDGAEFRHHRRLV